MIKQLTLRSNGQLIGTDSLNEVHFSINILEEPIKKMLQDKVITGDTDLVLPLQIEPVKISQWFEVPKET